MTHVHNPPPADLKSTYIDDVAPGLEIDFQNYWDSEEKVIKPALEAKGYKVLSFYSIEYDSFGPLIRGIHVRKDGQFEVIWYG